MSDGKPRVILKSVDGQFDACVIDTNPDSHIRLIASLAAGDFVVSPIQLNQEAIDVVRALRHHSRVGIHKINTVLRAKLTLIGLLAQLIGSTHSRERELLRGKSPISRC